MEPALKPTTLLCNNRNAFLTIGILYKRHYVQIILLATEKSITHHNIDMFVILKFFKPIYITNKYYQSINIRLNIYEVFKTRFAPNKTK